MADLKTEWRGCTKELRLLIAETMLHWAFKIAPQSREKNDLGLLINVYTRRRGEIKREGR